MRCRLKNRAPWLDLPASGCRLKNGAPATVLRRAGHAPPSANRCKPHVRPSTREGLPQSSAQSSHLVRVQSLVPAPGCCTRNALPATTCGHALPSSPFTHVATILTSCPHCLRRGFPPMERRPPLHMLGTKLPFHNPFIRVIRKEADRKQALSFVCGKNCPPLSRREGTI